MRLSKGRYPKVQTGFTLLEVLVALTLLAMLLTASFSAFFTLNNTAERVSRVSGDNHFVLSVSKFLKRKISLAQPYSWLPEEASPFGEEDTGVMLWGGEHGLEWLGVMSPSQDLGGVHFMRLGISDDQRLCFQWLPYSSGSVEWADRQEVLLTEEKTSLEVAYYNSVTSQWQMTWKDFQVLPRYIRLKMTLDGEPWPMLLLELDNWTPE